MIKLSIKFCIIMCIYLKDFGVADLRKQMAAITMKRLIQSAKNPNNFRTCKSPYYAVAFSFENTKFFYQYHLELSSYQRTVKFSNAIAEVALENNMMLFFLHRPKIELMLFLCNVLCIDRFPSALKLFLFFTLSSPLSFLLNSILPGVKKSIKKYSKAPRLRNH